MDSTGYFCVSNNPGISIENKVNICVLILRVYGIDYGRFRVEFGADRRKLLLTIEQSIYTDWLVLTVVTSV